MTTHVIAAIPAYNMSEQVLPLVGQLLTHKFDAIYVLDDASKDQSVKLITEKFGDKVRVIAGEKNLGAAGNRNRIIPALQKDGYGGDTIIMFVDADAELVSPSDIPATIHALFAKYPSAGMIGGKVLNSDRTWGAFNYGPLGLWDWLTTSSVQLKLEQLSLTDEAKARRVWASKDMQAWPNPFQEPVAREVGWLVETLNCIRLGVFAEVGGYNAHLRYCEALDLAYKLDKRGYARVFDPSIVVRHLQIDNRGARRPVEVIGAIPRLVWQRLTS